MRPMLLGLLAAGALTAAADAPTPPPIHEETGVVVGKGGDDDLKLDLALPAGDGPFPVVICIHGGGWVGGDRTQLHTTLKRFAGRGYVAASPDYRLAPKNRFPAQIEDCKAAVRFLRANAKQYHIDPERIGVVGFAAGGHLACLLGVTAKGDDLEGTGGNPDESSRVQAVVSFFGPTDLTTDDWGKEAEEKNLIPLMGGPRADKPHAYRRASPVTYAGKDAPPFLFVHGVEDKIVRLEQSTKLADKLKEAGASARVVALEGEGHGLRAEQFRLGLDEMLTFIDSHLKKR
jgi:acetyl esterase/lipase